MATLGKRMCFKGIDQSLSRGNLSDRPVVQKPLGRSRDYTGSRARISPRGRPLVFAIALRSGAAVGGAALVPTLMAQPRWAREVARIACGLRVGQRIGDSATSRDTAIWGPAAHVQAQGSVGQHVAVFANSRGAAARRPAEGRRSVEVFLYECGACWARRFSSRRNPWEPVKSWGCRRGPTPDGRRRTRRVWPGDRTAERGPISRLVGGPVQGIGVRALVGKTSGSSRG